VDSVSPHPNILIINNNSLLHGVTSQKTVTYIVMKTSNLMENSNRCYVWRRDTREEYCQPSVRNRSGQLHPGEFTSKAIHVDSSWSILPPHWTASLISCDVSGTWKSTVNWRERKKKHKNAPVSLHPSAISGNHAQAFVCRSAYVTCAYIYTSTAVAFPKLGPCNSEFPLLL
jgi:hypothetical protein